MRYEAGYRTASFDRDFNMEAMDFLKPAGFLYPDRMCSCKCYFFSQLGSRTALLAPFEALPVGGYGHGARCTGDGSPRL